MKLIRLLILFAVAYAPTTRAIAASEWKKFDAACDKGKWAAAAQMVPRLDASDSSLYRLKCFIQVYEGVGDYTNALRYKERILWHEDMTGGFQPFVPLAQEVIKIAAYAREKKIPSTDPFVSAYLQLVSDDPISALSGLAALDALRSTNATHPNRFAQAVADKLFREGVFPAFLRAAKQQDWKNAAKIAGYAGKLTDLSAIELQAYGDVFEKLEGPKGALRYYILAIRASVPNPVPLWSRPPNECIPEKLKELAVFAYRHQLKSGIPVLDAYVLHLEGKTAMALVELEKIGASRPESDFDDIDPHVPLALFLAGDLWLEQKEYRNALSCYHQATFADYIQRRRRIYHSGYHGDLSSLSPSTKYQRALGTIRQAQVLLLMDRPGLADQEMSDLINNDEDAKNTIATNPELTKAWNDALAQIKVCFGKISDPPDALDPSFRRAETIDGFVEGDVVFDKGGTLVPRVRSAYIYKFTAAEARREESAYMKAEYEKESARRAANSQTFMESYLASQARPVTETSPANSSSSSRAFDFQGRLTGNRNASQLRRCASCLGSGKANYVLGGNYYAVDSHGQKTNERVVAPECSACGGAGWR
jgi:hypothetical protein